MGSEHRVRRQLAHLAVGLALAGLTLTAPGSIAAAAPDYPSAVEVERSRGRAADAAQQVGSIEARLAAATARSEQLATGVAQAVEAYNGARFRLTEAVQAADAARAQVRLALGQVEVARDELGKFAAAAYRTGGDLSGLTIFLDADGPRDLISRASAIETIGDQRHRALEGVRASEVVAGVLETRARDLVKDRQDATAEVARAKKAAEAKLAQQQQAVREIAAQRELLVRVLAKARHTTIRLERERQDGIEAERAAAARRAAERRQREREEQQEQQEQQQGGGSSDGGGSGGGGSGGGSGGGGSGGGGSGGGGSGGGGGSTDPGGTSSGTTSGAERAISYAYDQIGKPYEWAATGPDTFDCSGLTMRAWERGGVMLPHYSVAQYEQSAKVGLGSIRRGDLVFFASDKSDHGTIYHVGLYIGGGQMIEAPYTGEEVRVASIYRDSLFGAARP